MYNKKYYIKYNIFSIKRNYYGWITIYQRRGQRLTVVIEGLTNLFFLTNLSLWSAFQEKSNFKRSELKYLINFRNKNQKRFKNLLLN